jgi:hypothetical protein
VSASVTLSCLINTKSGNTFNLILPKPEASRHSPPACGAENRVLELMSGGHFPHELARHEASLPLELQIHQVEATPFASELSKHIQEREQKRALVYILGGRASAPRF